MRRSIEETEKNHVALDNTTSRVAMSGCRQIDRNLIVRVARLRDDIDLRKQK
jgi:hypothetical protein